MRIAVAGLTLAIVACDDRPRQWDAFIYPDSEGSEKFVRISGFKTFELCRDAATDRIQSFPEPEKAAYECGYMCRFEPTYGMNVCKETRD